MENWLMTIMNDFRYECKGRFVIKKLIVVLITLLLAGCDNVQHHPDLSETIYSIVENKNSSEISLKSLTSFDWEKAFLFTPYTTQEEIEERLDVNFNDPSNIDYRDDIYLLVLMNDGIVDQYVEVARQGADFKIGEKEYLTPSADLIFIERY
ncbi:hypothetical protein [Saliterribacillus persicus]|uniref:Uncharacterized protein n=1 Tax=Saliterribacillus persicus TaxID=930114 RepID=A0A368XBT0_9BACI|nr:hypothetical protein [Saliterribacillus persicus]RCW63897.1 hypothetical protein DFR57_11522 [Saliterribacillus persicus]